MSALRKYFVQFVSFTTFLYLFLVVSILFDDELILEFRGVSSHISYFSLYILCIDATVTFMASTRY